MLNTHVRLFPMAYCKFLAAVFCGLFYISQAGETSDCSAGWFKYDLHCYQVHLKRADWATALLNCQDRRSDLASIHSELENDLIWSQLPKGRKFWLGLSLVEAASMPGWSDSSSVVFTNWAKNEHNRLNNTCTYVQSEDGKWKGISCDTRLVVDGYICKRPLDILLFPLSTNNSPGCEPGGYAYNNVCYYWYNDTKSWGDAQKVCQISNGNLVTVSNKLTLTFISSIFGPQTSPYWISINMRNGSYRWANRLSVLHSVFQFTNEPNKTDCFSTTLDLQHWESHICSDQLPFVCEKQRDDLTTDGQSFQQELQPACPLGWTEKDDVCFKYFSQQTTWQTAQSHCESLGGNLISIHDDRTQSFIFTFLTQRRPLLPVWLGLNDILIELRYQWSDESPFDFSVWSRGEPNSLSVSEDCTEMLSTDGKWNVNNCHVVRPYICAIKRGTSNDPMPMFTIEETDPVCAEKDWIYHNGFCYYISTVIKSWNRARKYCLSNGGDLASILSEDESNFIINLQSKKSIRDIWIGLNKKNQDHYVWSDGSPTVHLSWYPTQPRDVEGSELCVTMKIDHGRWFNSRCFKDLPFLCKRKNDSSEVLISSPSPVKDGVCPDGFVGLNNINKCYYTGGTGNDIKLSWSRAREVCNAMISSTNVVLASINSPQEQETIAELISSHQTNYWIGLRDFFEDGVYNWMDGSEVEYTQWAQGQPLTINPHTFSHQNYPYRFLKSGKKILNDNIPALLPCVEVIGNNQSSDDNKWSSAECDKKNAYICQTFKIHYTTNDTPAYDSITATKGRTKAKKDSTSATNESITATNNGTDTDVMKFGNLSYIIEDKEMVTWPEAEQKCHSKGMQLVSFHSTDEVQFLLQNVLNSSLHDPSEQQYTVFWIGLFVTEKGLFQWSDNTLVTYSNWDIGHPSINPQGRCAALDSRTGEWTDIDCLTHRLGFICRSKQNSYTERVADEKTNNAESQIAILVLTLQILSVCIILTTVILFLKLRKTKNTSKSKSNQNSLPTVVYLAKQEVEQVMT